MPDDTKNDTDTTDEDGLELSEDDLEAVAFWMSEVLGESISVDNILDDVAFNRRGDMVLVPSEQTVRLRDAVEAATADPSDPAEDGEDGDEADTAEDGEDGGEGDDGHAGDGDADPAPTTKRKPAIVVPKRLPPQRSKRTAKKKKPISEMTEAEYQAYQADNFRKSPGLQF